LNGIDFFEQQMKRLIFTLSLVFAVFIVKAQVKAGIEVGLNLSTWLGSVEKFNYRTGFFAGGKIIYYFDNEKLIQSGIYYSREGWKDVIDIDNEDVTQVLELNYLVIPLDFGIFVGGDRFRGLRFDFGVNFKPLLNYKLISQLDSGDEPAEPKTEISNFDIGAKLGVDYKLDENIGLSFIIELGTIKANKTTSSTYLRLNNQSFKFGVYYLF
jgi:hypothetical protein